MTLNNPTGRRERTVLNSGAPTLRPQYPPDDNHGRHSRPRLGANGTPVIDLYTREGHSAQPGRVGGTHRAEMARARRSPGSRAGRMTDRKGGCVFTSLRGVAHAITTCALAVTVACTPTEWPTTNGPATTGPVPTPAAGA